MKNSIQYIDVEIDKLTNSIENSISGDSFKTEVSFVDKVDIKKITKAKGWLFNWKAEFEKPDRDVYKLTINNNPSIIQGLLSEFNRKTRPCLHALD